MSTVQPQSTQVLIFMRRIFPVLAVLLTGVFLDGKFSVPVRAEEISTPTVRHTLPAGSQDRATGDASTANRIITEVNGAAWGFIDREGRPIVPPRFLEAESFAEERAVVRVAGHGFSYIDTHGNLVNDRAFDRACSFAQERAHVWMNDAEYFINPAGEIVFQWKVSTGEALHCRQFSHGKLAVFDSAHGAAGFLNRNGEWDIRPQYTTARDFHENRAVIQTGNLFGYIDVNGRTIIEPQFRIAHDFSEGMAYVEISPTERGFIDPQGEFVFRIDAELRTARLFDFHGQRARFERQNTYGYLDRSGKVAIDAHFNRYRNDDGFADFQENLAVFIEARGAGYIKPDGRSITDNRFDEAYPYHEGRAVARQNDRYGYLDVNGEWIIPPRFLGAGAFAEGLAPVKIDEAARDHLLPVDLDETFRPDQFNAE
ncbi:MAG: WG repeat-containing protein [Leptospiraceae bacterium]|nr:WG repeat-containing protein [Leptospiraceae bacterium]